jgi:uncharacterized protein YlxW (UPF0749 family)
VVWCLGSRSAPCSAIMQSFPQAEYQRVVALARATQLDNDASVSQERKRIMAKLKKENAEWSKAAAALQESKQKAEEELKGAHAELESCRTAMHQLEVSKRVSEASQVQLEFMCGRCTSAQ